MDIQKTNQKEEEKLFGRKNYILLMAGSILILSGYLLMSGKGSDLTAYNPDIFSTLRIRIAPMLCLTGYLINIFGLVCSHKTKL